MIFGKVQKNTIFVCEEGRIYFNDALGDPICLEDSSRKIFDAGESVKTVSRPFLASIKREAQLEVMVSRIDPGFPVPASVEEDPSDF